MTGADAWSAIQLVAATIVGGCFVLSGIAKLRDGSGTAETFRALGVPAVADRPWIHRAYPWVELVVGVGVLLAPAWVWWPIALIAALMLAALTTLVARVVAGADAVSCNCFGTREPLTARTLTRNAIFLAFSVILVASAPSSPSPVLAAVPDRIPLLVGVLLAAAAATLLTVLSRAPGDPLPRDAETYEDRTLHIPDLRVTDTAGASVALPSLVVDGPVLLVFVKHGCGPCREVIAELADGDRIADRVLVRLIERMPAAGPDASRSRLWDQGARAAYAVGLRSTPSAVLLAADRTIPTNPVYGPAEIRMLVAGIEEAVARSTPPPLGDVIA